MTINRIEKFLSPAALNSGFTEVMLQHDIDSLFEGPTLDMLIKEELEKAKHEGYVQAIEDFIKNIQSRIETHVKNLIKTGTAIQTTTAKSLPQLNIKQVRAKYSSEPTYINMFFVINAKPEEEINFAKILDRFESFLLNEKNIVAEIYCVNEHDKNIDYGMLKNDYPLALNIDKILNAA